MLKLEAYAVSWSFGHANYLFQLSPSPLIILFTLQGTPATNKYLYKLSKFADALIRQHSTIIQWKSSDSVVTNEKLVRRKYGPYTSQC